MRIENALRWQRLWWFISLNFLRRFIPDLWLHVPIKDFQEHVQSRIDSKRDLPTFESDPRLKAYQMLTSVKDTFGGDALEYLCMWQKYVFVQGGDDRVEEFVWGMLAYELFERSSEFKLPAEFHAVLKSFHSLREKRLSEFKKRLSDASATSLSVWDRNAIAAEGESLDTVITLLTNICSSNIFALTWHETFTSRGLAFLKGIFEVALRAASEDKSGRLIFSADALPFPSSWEFEFERIWIELS
jgi:hypothetical protein